MILFSFLKPLCWRFSFCAMVQASLALSTEPCGARVRLPAAHQAPEADPWQALPKRPSKYAKRREWFAFFFTYFMAFFWDVLFLFPSLVSQQSTVPYSTV